MDSAIAEPPIVAAVRRFVDDEVRPAVRALEHADLYPHALVERMRELGLFGALVPQAYGGLGLAVMTYARVIEELCRGWMSLAGVINSHTMAALIVVRHGTEEQRARLLPRFARGDARGGLCLTEPHAGSDVQAIRTRAEPRGDGWVLNGTKMFVTNGREGNTFALLALTDVRADPPHRGMSCFIVEKGHPGLRVAKSIAKLGYKGVDTAELVFEDFPVAATNLVGGVTGRGFRQVMDGLEAGRINIAARAVGVAQAAYEDTLAGASQGTLPPPPALAEMAARVEAARLLTYWAAGMKDRGERCDLEAGMAKLHASEAAHAVARAALGVAGAPGLGADRDLERYYRDTPLMIIGEGTNEIQRTLIARQLVERHGERAGALVARDSESGDRREMILAVRRFVDKAVAPVAQELDVAAAFPDSLLAGLADLGVLGALVDQDAGGLGVDALTWTMLLEEIARGSATLALLATVHTVAAHLIARLGSPTQRAQLLGPLTRGETLATLAAGAVLGGEAGRVRTSARVVNAPRADLFVVWAPACMVLRRDGAGVRLEPAPPALGTRALTWASLVVDERRAGRGDALHGGGNDGRASRELALDLLRLGGAAIAVGLAQAAFEAALRYAQQRTAFGKPICQHQAIQLKLADMATSTAAARLLLYAAAERGGPWPGLARLLATDTACEVTLEAMRVHGGYGYTAEFPVERHYRDAAQLATFPLDNDGERQALATALVAPLLRSFTDVASGG